MALAMLHDARIGTDRSWTTADETGVIDRALGSAAEARPELASGIAHVRRLSHAVLRALPDAEATGLHRDFYLDQVLIDGDAVWLVDLDLYATGDPMIDVGNFLAHLTESGLREHADPGRLATECGAFLSGYETERGRVDRKRLQVLHWGALIRHIGISHRIAERRRVTEALIALCVPGPGGPAFRRLFECAA
jgi:Ser/Thr protein kinase RdoA (MazF antagonist)